MARVRADSIGPAIAEDARSRLPLGRLLAVCAVALTTANCANAPQKFAAGTGSDVDPKYGVRASKRLYNEGDAIPKGGGRRYSGKPYVVAGRTYVPRDDARGYVREGLASWYGSAFHGRMTANGEVFDRHSIAAAHPTLPLPSYARVTNLDSGRSMIVRVNDRGPYHENRVMDLSEEAARALDFHRSGTARVRVEYVGKASIAGSDDRKLLATLRTDGRPAAIGSRSPVMVADLGSDAAEPSPERFARPAQRALAFKAPDEDAPAPAMPRQPGPVVLASRSSVTVPAALQPTAQRTASFRPAPVTHMQPGSKLARAEASPARPKPLSIVPPPMQVASAGRAKAETPSRATPNAPARVAATKDAGMSNASKLAMAKLAAAAAPTRKAGTAPDAKAARRRMAGID